MRGGEKGKIPARECEREWDEKGTGRGGGGGGRGFFSVYRIADMLVWKWPVICGAWLGAGFSPCA